MRDERLEELARSVFTHLVGKNDAIAADPSRWYEEMQSWSADELTALVKMTLREAVNEAYDNAAIKIDSYVIGLDALKRGRASIDGAEGAAKIVRSLKELR